MERLDDDSLLSHLIPWIFLKYHEDKPEEAAEESEAASEESKRAAQQRRQALRIAKTATTLACVSRWWYLLMAHDEHLWRRVVLQLHAALGTPVRFAHGSWRNTLFVALLQRALPAVLPSAGIVLPAARVAAFWRAQVECGQFVQLPWRSTVLRVDLAACPVALDAALLARFPRQPFILAASAVADWPAVRDGSWTAARLAERFADVEFVVQRPDDDDDDVRMRFADFLAYSLAQHDESPLYVFDRKFWKRAPPMLGEWRQPALFDASVDLLRALDERIRPTLKWLVIGPQRTGASWHRDPLSTSAWNTLLQGRKRWAIYPPDVVPPGVWVERDADGVVTDWHSPSSVYWFAHVYPTLAEHERPYIECIQELHETIYVPAHWWHCVLNLELTVAVTENFGEEAYASHIVREIYELNDDPKARQRHTPGDQVDDSLPFTELVDAWAATSDCLREAAAEFKSSGDEDDEEESEDSDDDEARRVTRTARFSGDCERVCAALGISTAGGLTTMTYGQNPAFSVDGRVVKLVQPRFLDSLENERRALRVLAGQSDAFLPLLASGLEPCPFVVTALVADAVPLRAVWNQLSAVDDMLLAKWCAETVAVLRKCTPRDADATAFQSSVARWRANAPYKHALACTLPPLLVPQVSSFLAQHLPTALGSDELQLLHGDINDENVLVRRSGAHWQPVTLVDFGDSFAAGDVLYELMAVYCSALRCLRPLMAAFAVQSAARVLNASPCTLMAYALVHPCDPLSTALQWRPELQQSAVSLEALADAIFGIASAPAAMKA